MDDTYNDLRQKLVILGYEQTLPVTAVPIVGAIIADLTKTTESLLDAKKQIHDLLEEKACWELGVEPYKCDNARLLTECNKLHMDLVKDREAFDERQIELKKTIRDLENDKHSLLEHQRALEKQLKNKPHEPTAGTIKSNVSVFNMRKRPRKPFISTVRSGDSLPPLAPLTENNANVRCAKCHNSVNRSCDDKMCVTENASHTWLHAEIERLEANLTDLNEQIMFTKRKVESREREIDRLNEMLTGGRPLAALAKDCCYKEMRVLAADIKQLQQEKASEASRYNEYVTRMHMAMERSLKLEADNQKLQNQFAEMQAAALEVEDQANEEVAQRDRQLEGLKVELQSLHKQLQAMLKDGSRGAAARDMSCAPNTDADMGVAVDVGNCRGISHAQTNEFKKREIEHLARIEHLENKVRKLKVKIHELQKEINDVAKPKDHFDEEKIRVRNERDFYQKEFLRVVSKIGSGKEIEFLQSLIKSKDEELLQLRKDMLGRHIMPASNTRSAEIGSGDAVPSTTIDATTAREESDSTRGHCVQALVLRAERDRDCARIELERIRSERDMLREKHLSMTQAQHETTQATMQRFVELNDAIIKLEEEKRKFSDISRNTETHIVILREEIDMLKQRNDLLKTEHDRLRTAHNKLLMLHEQTERSLTIQLSKLTTAERELESADERCADRDKDAVDIEKLQCEVEALKSTYKGLEHEKDDLVRQLNEKTQRANEFKRALEECEVKRDLCERRVKCLEEELKVLNHQTEKFDNNMHETYTLRNQLQALQTSRDNAIAENSRLAIELAESMSEILNLKRRVKDSEGEIERMKQQLHQYVQEVKKAEDLLMSKEREREEMLDHYRSLSQDAVMLEGNNQSLENEAAEYKRQIVELESEIEQLKAELVVRNEHLVELDDKISAQEAHIQCQERRIEQADDDERLLKVDLAARKELCDKLDNERDKLNAELDEMNAIRQKLQTENEKLRNDLEEFNKNGDNMSTDALEELLNKTRRDLEEQIRTDTRLGQELLRMRQRNEELLNELEDERKRRRQQEAAANEYRVQNQELRHNMTDDRFRQARSREQSPRFPTQTL